MKTENGPNRRNTGAKLLALAVLAAAVAAHPRAARADEPERWAGDEWDEDSGQRGWNDDEAEQVRSAYARHDDDDEDDAYRRGYQDGRHDSDRDDGDERGPAFDDFRHGLNGYGEWIDTPEYGRVWRPAVGASWRPYYFGRWEWTTAGWMWVSDEPFGWAVYHYGRWAFVNESWVWLPGRIWAPAWVSWQWGGG